MRRVHSESDNLLGCIVAHVHGRKIYDVVVFAYDDPHFPRHNHRPPRAAYIAELDRCCDERLWRQRPRRHYQR